MLTTSPNNLAHDPRALLIDFDGTLGNTLAAWTDAFDAVLQLNGVRVPQEQVIHYCFHSCPDEVIRNHGIADGIAFKERVWSDLVERMSSVEPYKEVVETLGALRSHGFKLAVVTNTRRAAIEPVLSRWNIRHHFDAVVTIEDVSHGKPDPEMLHHALNKLNVSPSRTYILGDSKSDVVAGKRAGIKTIGFSPQENWKYLALDALRFTEPSHLVHSYADLREVLGVTPLPHQNSP
jgi:pyrophosphatase PpaX